MLNQAAIDLEVHSFADTLLVACGDVLHESEELSEKLRVLS
jgi:hypothetical protein